MNKNEEMICDDCGVTFLSSRESQSPIKHCPKCVKKIQEKMLNIMFGEPHAKSDGMHFSPNNPENIEDLYALIDTELNEVVVVIYESDNGTFYHHKGQWMELSDEDNHFDFDGLMVVYVDSSFIAIYAQAEDSSNPIGMDELKNYISKK
jgi:hypothetical protein